jgi:hypothetical protein
VYSTSVFTYIPRQIVVLLTGYSPRKYMPVYAKPLTLNKGVDNQIQFQFLNQEQKPVDITGKEITCRVINRQGTTVLLKKALTLQLPATGIAALFVNAAEIEDINPQQAYYSLEIPVGEFDYPVFVDQNAGARGDMNIVNSVLPSFVPSQSVSIPTGQPFPNLDINNNIDNVLPNAATYYSSVINTEDNPILTLQAHFYQYNGDVTIEATTNQGLTDWYPITTTAFSNNSTTTGWTINGYHPYVRMVFISNTGAVSNILAR